MHPFLARGDRLALYLVLWLNLGGLLAGALSRQGGLSLPQAAAVLLPLSIVYGFVCLSSWYVVRATPPATGGLGRTLVNIGGSALVAGAAWLAIGRIVAWGADQVPALAGASDRVAAEAPLLFLVGVILYLLALAVHFVLAGMDEARAVRQRAVEVQLLAREAELKALRAQIEPHFLFNSLNSISALTTTDAAGARRMCVLLGEFLRETLSVGARDRTTVAGEIGLAMRYLEIERVRFGARLRVERAVGEAAATCLIPPLLLQPLVENAVGHGVAGLTDGGTISIRADRQDDAVVIVIENPADPDRPSGRRRGVGLDNVRRRLASEYGARARLDVVDRDGRFTATVRLPAAGS